MRAVRWLIIVTLVMLGMAGEVLAQEASPAAAGSAVETAPPGGATAPTPAAPAAAVPPDAGMQTADDAYEIKLKGLEEKVNQLKEKIFRSKTRLLLLQETILHGVIAGSKVVISHKNDMGPDYKLESVAYYLDGAPIYGKIDIDGSLNSDQAIEIYNGTITPGNHLISVYMVYRGDNPMFVYVEGIQVKLRTSYTFKAEEGKVTRINVAGYDKGGPTAKFEERPAVRFDTTYGDLQEEEIQSPEGGGAGGGN